MSAFFIQNNIYKMAGKYRTGIGIDVHKLQEGIPLMLGGIQIPFHLGAVGHSDADVLLHAICDALLGAANLNDIGYHFSDKSPEYKGIDSKILLKRVGEMIREKGYEICNIDSTVALQEPKISSYIPKMKQTIADTLNISVEDISIKATTTENLGYEGRKEGITAYANVLIYK